MNAESRDSNFQPYNTQFGKVEITERERVMGPRTLQIFEKVVKRRLAWMVEGDGLITTIETPRNPHVLNDPSLPRIRQGETIDLADLANEHISEDLARAVEVSKFVEDFLPDYTKAYVSVSRAYHGLTLAAAQWSVEEGQHGRVDGIILEETGHADKGSMGDKYLQQQETEFYIPFSTTLELLSYAMLQEKMASINYSRAARRATQEGAPTVAKILTLIAADEGWHAMGYRTFFDEFAKYDPEAAKEAALHVASNFRMPAEHLLDNRYRRKAFISTGKVGFLYGDEYEKLIFNRLNSFDFISESEARQAAKACMNQHVL